MFKFYGDKHRVVCDRCTNESELLKKSLPFMWREIGEKHFCNICVSGLAIEGKSIELGDVGISSGIPERESGRARLNPYLAAQRRLHETGKAPIVGTVESKREMMARKRKEGKVIRV